jgi:1-carboxybiuret hydrolase
VTQAQRLRADYRASVLKLFAETDILIAPATPFAATPIGQANIELEGELVPIRPNLGIFTQPISCIGLPVLAVPLADPSVAGTPNGLPIGVQLIAAPWREDVLFRAAAALERAGVVGAPPARM